MAIKNYNTTPFKEKPILCILDIYNSKNKFHIHDVNKSACPQVDSSLIGEVNETYYKQFIEAIRALEYNCDFIDTLSSLKKVNDLDIEKSTLEEIKDLEQRLFYNLEILKNLSKRENRFTYNIEALNGCNIKTLNASNISNFQPSKEQLLITLRKSKNIAINFYYFIYNEIFQRLSRRGKIENLYEDFEALTTRLKSAINRTNQLIETLNNDEFSIVNLRDTLSSQDLYQSIKQTETIHSK